MTTRSLPARILKHAVLISFALLAILPVLMIVMNSFKERRAIFSTPYIPPNLETLDLIGYQTVFLRSEFEIYYKNSLIITLGAVLLIVFLGAMASHALIEFPFRGSDTILVFFLLGIIIPIRLGSVSLLRFIVSLGLVDTLVALILVYTAQGLPLSIFILTQFMQQIPSELKEAARIDGASEYRIFFIVLPFGSPCRCNSRHINNDPHLE